MMPHSQAIKPKAAQPRQNFALAGNPAGQNVVKRTDSVGCNKQQPIAKVVYVPYFPTSNWNTGQFTLKNDLRHSPDFAW